MSARIHTITLNPAIDHTVQIDELTPGAVHRAKGQQLEAGGKGFGVAAIAASLGAPVTATGWLGADNDALFVRAFASRNITDGMVRILGSTRTNIKLADAARGATTDINLPGLALDAAALQHARQALAGHLAQTVSPGDWCELAGSLPPGVDGSVWLQILQTLAERDAHVVVDISGTALKQVLEGWSANIPGPALFKPNQAELEELMGKPLPGVEQLAHAARQLLARGVQRVIVSLGGDGALLASAEGCWLARALQVPVATTVGAGDALVGGTMAALREGQPFVEAAVFGMACAAARIQRVAPGLPPLPQVQALAAQITLTEI